MMIEEREKLIEEVDISSVFLSFNLQYFADEGGEKTEEPTAKKISDARKEGQVAKSHEIVVSGSLLGLFVAIKLFTSFIAERFMNSFNVYYEMIGTIVPDNKPTTETVHAIFSDVYVYILITALPMLAIAFVVSFGMNAFQVKWEPTGKPLQPKLSRLNPIKGFSKIFSKSKLFDLVRDVLKIALVFYLAYSTLKGEMDKIKILYDLDLLPSVALIGNITVNLGLKISGFYFIIGFIDYIYQRWKFKKDLMMSKQEIKDEFKEQEGDPQIKGKRQQKMREASRRRMMEKVPKADVVITNPTHYACALTYDREKSKAPVLVCKGADYVAMKIKEIARENNVPIVENKPLARMLYHNVELDEEIPAELYQMTAEVLAYVYSLKEQQ
ncbi:MAG: flagellar biosynthesis protein FlhB [Lachnospiraceae bacterium]|nr:flagellar biosynthesis protein FlhB [Lachnospiraceae bacterium]